MARIEIKCSEYEMKQIKEALIDKCPFEIGTIKNCGEDADCNDCQEENIAFTVIESEGNNYGNNYRICKDTVRGL